MSSTQYRKPRKPRQLVGADDNHWLGEWSEGGVGAQELLFDEVSPLLLSLDSELASEVNRVVHSKSRPTGARQALFVPPPGSYGWQLSFLAKHFKVNIWSAEDDESYLKFAEQFDAHVFAGDIPERLRGEISLAIFTDALWKNHQEFVQSVAEILGFLAEDGVALFCLEGVSAQGSENILWADGSSSALSALAGAEAFLPTIGEPASCISAVINPVALRAPAFQSTFLKRHREFFGKDARGILELRCQGRDYHQFEECLDVKPLALLLRWAA